MTVSAPMRTALVLAIVTGVLGLIRPWTIRPIDAPAPAAAAVFDPDAQWTRVRDEAARSAVDVGSLTDATLASGRRALFVKGEGIVTRVDTSFRVGVMTVQQAAGGRSIDCVLQIGPVLRGTAVRDAASFIEFSDFTNQSAFAAAGNALNDRVLRDVLSGLDVQALEGRRVSFVGAAPMPESAAAGRVEVVPLLLRIQEAR